MAIDIVAMMAMAAILEAAPALGRCLVHLAVAFLTLAAASSRRWRSVGAWMRRQRYDDLISRLELQQ